MDSPLINGNPNKRKTSEGECETPKKMKNEDSNQPGTPKSKNATGQFNEKCQKYHVEPKIEYFEKIDYDGESRNSSWNCQISLNGSIAGSAWAKQKKEAKEAACALSLFKFDEITPKSITNSPAVGTSSTVKMNEICQKVARTSLSVSYPPHKPDGVVESSVFKCEVSIPEYEFITGTGFANTKKLAKAIACTDALSKIETLKTKPDQDLSLTERTLLSHLALSSSTAKSPDNNNDVSQSIHVSDPTSAVYSQILILEKDGSFTCLKKRDPFGCLIRLCLLAKQPPIDPVFTSESHEYRCSLKLASWTATGNASSKKQAKYLASLQLLDRILLHPTGDSENGVGNS